MNAAPDYAEAFEGWRVWRVVDRGNGARLHSVHFDAEWVPGERLEAGCQQRRRSLRHPLFGLPTGHPAPVLPCRCGIHALPSAAQAAAYLESLALNCGFPTPYAIGKVALWGTVAEHVDGWRAGFAYPRAIHLQRMDRWSSERLGEIAEELALYAVPVTVPEPQRAAVGVDGNGARLDRRAWR